MSIQGKCIIVVGSRGTGKTTKCKQLLAKAHPEARLVLDVYGDYRELFPHDPIEFKTFIKMAMTAKNAVILIEETTIYLSNRGYDGDVVDLLVKLRNKGNTLILVYHSLRAIPTYIYEMTNLLVIHKTNDRADDILKRFDDEKLVEIFNELKNTPNLKAENGLEYSPSKVYKIC